MKRIVFIGAGSMAESMIKGLIKSGTLTPKQITATNKSNKARLKELHDVYEINTEQDIGQAVAQFDTIVLAVKPKDAAESIEKIQPYLHKEQLIISILAGISIDTIQHFTRKKLPIVRAMPNTSASIQKSATAFTAGPYVTEEQIDEVTNLFHTIGSVTMVEETALDAVTAVAGSGPAFVYRFVEALEKSARELGLDELTAKQLIIDMIIGAAQMLESGKEPALLRKEITSPGGTTEAGIRVLHELQFEKTVITCVKEAAKRSAEMREQLTAK
ncbi:pyrroline-5-carboxylate reductase [Bacillus sp. CLL-7-23]|uniref:Pyrroline-5-carboxylate reductase n=1 Tax=Bacillus changyiensis TaxID=3004103 RepID=A0ABT4X6L4_9BACI|nr:pyrroline-5-carboxylate reductase [Bacillus changyiensis]MDA7027051.1 pyrroline-5-carboxylate reductase [Bacillus changyiensis]